MGFIVFDSYAFRFTIREMGELLLDFLPAFGIGFVRDMGMWGLRPGKKGSSLWRPPDVEPNLLIFVSNLWQL
jgi:hypothetical protein